MLPAIVLIGAICAAYFNSLHGAFVWDDIPTIVQNRSFEHLASILDRPAAVNTTSGRPLVSVSLALNYALGGRNPFGYHLFNVLVHAAAALALFGFVRRLAQLPRWIGRYETHATGLALAVAAAWALHPLQTQAVSYVIQRAESLMGLCYLLTLWSFLRSAHTRHPAIWRTVAIAACALGMMAKEVMVSAPVVVLLFDRTFLAGSFRKALATKRAFYGALFGTWLILFWLVASLGGNRDGSTGGFSLHAAWFEYWLTQFSAVATYVKLTFWPHPLIFQYGTFWLPQAIAALPAACLVMPLLALMVVALFRWPEAGFFGFWFCSILAVTSVVPGTVDMIVEHRMYLALAPLWILVAAALYARGWRLAFGVLGALTIGFAVITVARNRDYRSQLALWTDNVAKRPDNPLARYNLAVELLRAPGREAEAQVQLETAVKLAPEFAGAHYNLAVLLSQRSEQWDQAIAHFEQAIRIAPGYSQAHNNLAMLLDRRGEVEAACRHLQRAVQSDPSNRVAWLNLVSVLEESRRPDDALTAAAALVQAHPDFADGQAKYGIMLAVRQRFTESIPHLETALRLDPSQAMARYYLGSTLVQLHQRLPEAIALLEQVIKLRPDSANAHFNLGIAYLIVGSRVHDAIEQFTAATQLDPQDPNAHFNLGGALEAAGGDPAKAIAHFRAAATLQPNVAVNHFRLARLLARDSRARAEARTEVLATLALDPDFPGARALLEQIDAAGR